MAIHDNLGKRMKTFYESVSKTKLMRRTPVAIRIDGKAFHTFTKGFKKPFDYILMESMQETMQYLCENIQGCVLGYTQSDEITLILIDYQTLDASAWFDYEVQKVCSVAASMATMVFNRVFKEKVNEHEWEMNESWNLSSEDIFYMQVLQRAVDTGAMFDARCFNIPETEVTNLIYWRQLDAIRNSIQMVGQVNFSQKELHGKSCEQIKEMLAEQKGIIWNDLPTQQKRGSSCVRYSEYTVDGTVRNGWKIDREIPTFKGDGREYIEKLICFDEE